MLGVARHGRDHLVGHLPVELGRAARQHAAHPLTRVRVGGIAPLELAGELQPRRIHVRDRHTLNVVTGGEIDRAPVGHLRHREPGDGGQRLPGVERRRQHAAGLGEEAVPLLGALDVRDVLDHVDREPHGPRLVEHGRRLHTRPAVLGAAVVPVADGQRLGALAQQRPPPREAVVRDRLPQLVEHLEPVADLRRRRRQQLIRARVAEQAHGGVVRVRQPPVGRLGGDGVGHPVEDRLQLVARLARRRVQPRVVECQSAAVGQLLRQAHVLLVVLAPRL
jgi:hypothetical protein